MVTSSGQARLPNCLHHFTVGVSTCPRWCLFHAHQNPVFVVTSFAKVSFAFGCLAQFSGVLLALVQVRFSGYAAGFGWLLCGLGFSNLALKRTAYSRRLP